LLSHAALEACIDRSMRSSACERIVPRSYVIIGS
jgi:hypothetical protein